MLEEGFWPKENFENLVNKSFMKLKFGQKSFIRIRIFLNLK
jgi:hypothetical protein